jgi:hypothetical protein
MEPLKKACKSKTFKGLDSMIIENVKTSAISIQMIQQQEIGWLLQ